MRPSRRRTEYPSLSADGRWETDGNEIVLKRRGPEERVILRAKPVRADAVTLTAAILQDQTDQNPSGRTVTFDGAWKVDPQNRLSFEIRRLNDRSLKHPREIVFKGGWELNGRQEIVVKTGRAGSVTLRGAWDIGDKDSIVFTLEKGTALRFRGAFQSRSILAKDGEMRYQIGVEAKDGVRSNVVSFFGKWKLGRDLALEFEYGKPSRGRQGVEFGAVYRFTKGERIEATLMARSGAPLGLKVEFSKPVRGKDGELFVRLSRSIDESLVEGGLALKW